METLQDKLTALLNLRYSTYYMTRRTRSQISMRYTSNSTYSMNTTGTCRFIKQEDLILFLSERRPIAFSINNGEWVYGSNEKISAMVTKHHKYYVQTNQYLNKVEFENKLHLFLERFIRNDERIRM